jgi:predicted RNA-binding protein YlqC (UPF0109 family)
MASESSAEVCLLFNKLVRAMVDEPESVSVSATAMPDRTVVLKVKASPSDVGKLIGLGGRTSRSLRTILSTISKAQNQRFLLDINGDSRTRL